MSVDLCLLGVVLLFAVFGLQSGAIRQVTQWSGLAAGWFLCGPLASRLTPLVAARFKLPAAGVRVAAESLLFCFLSSAAVIVVHWLLSKLTVENGRVDRAGGMALGAAKGAALIFALVSLLVYFEKPLINHFGPPPPAVESSRIVALARAHNLLAEVPLPIASRLERLAQAARDPHATEAALAQEPGLQALLNDPQLKAALQNDTFLKALNSGDFSALKNDPRLAALLKDPRLAQNGQ